MAELTPNTRLAREISRKLVVQGPIIASNESALLQMLQSGTAKEEDWKHWAEQSLGNGDAEANR